VTTAIPTAPEELQELLADKPKLDAVYANPVDFAKFLTNYAKAANKADPDVMRQVDERVEKGLADFAKANAMELRRPDMRPATADDVRANRQTGAAYNKAAMGAPLDGQFDSFGSFLNAIDYRKDRQEPELKAKLSTLRNAMSSTVPSEGGFLIPEEFRAELLRVALETAVVRPRARVIPMASLRVALPALDVTSNAASVFGGMVAYWTEEAATLVGSQPTFMQVALEAKKLTCRTDVPSETVDDSAISIDAFLGEAFPATISWTEDAAFIAGTGVGEPLGALNTNNSALAVVAKEAGQAAATILWENIIKMYARMLPSSLNSAVWVVSPDTFPELATMALNVGTGGSAIWLNNGVQGPPMTILGRPVIISEKTSILGAQGDISFVDFSYYLIGDRMAMSAQSSAHARFTDDVIVYRVISRVDGRPWIQSAITPKNAGPALSPFVQLAVRA
jgi:HK97 family phage major capsid protein